MRQGELIGLAPTDVDFASRFIHARLTSQGGRVSTPKNGKTRRVDIPVQLTNVLDQLIAEKSSGSWMGIGERQKNVESRKSVVAEIIKNLLFTTPEIVSTSNPKNSYPGPQHLVAKAGSIRATYEKFSGKPSPKPICDGFGFTICATPMPAC